LPNELAEKAEVVSGDLRELVDGLRKREYTNLCIDGGRTIRGFLEADLIDEMIITRVPVILCDGVPLFGKIGRRLHFEHRETESMGPELTKSHYVRKRS
jgi:dihydrofolate reductase